MNSTQKLQALRGFIARSRSAQLTSIVRLSSGAFAAQLIGLFSFPLVARLYRPEDYGSLALFNSIVGIGVSFACYGYDAAIALPRENHLGERESGQLVTLCLLLAASSAIVVALVLLMPVSPVASYLARDLDNWMFAVPPAVFLGASSAVWYALATRRRLYKVTSRVAPLEKVGSVSIQMSLGLLQVGRTGLIIATIAGPIIRILALSSAWRTQFDLWRKRDTSLADLKNSARRYSDFPRFRVWTVLVSSLFWNSHIVFLSKMFDSAEVGTYSVSIAVLAIPMGVILSGVSQVYARECASRAPDLYSIRQLARRVLVSLGILSVPLFTSLVALCLFVLPAILGVEWERVGPVSVCLIPLLWAQFLSTSLSTTFVALRRQHQLLIWQVVILASSLICLGLAAKLQLTFLATVLTLSLTNAVWYLALIPFLFGHGLVNNVRS